MVCLKTSSSAAVAWSVLNPGAALPLICAERYSLKRKVTDIKNFTWHDLRHTFASRLVMAAVDLRTVAELMGHKRIQMTMRYAHLAPAHNSAAIEKLSAFNAVERKRQKADEPAILTPAAREIATGTR